MSWDTALDTAADRFTAIIYRTWPRRRCIAGAGQLLTKDYVFNKLMKGPHQNVISTPTPPCACQCRGRLQAEPGRRCAAVNSYDIALARRSFITGNNTAFAHPIVFRRGGRRPQNQPGREAGGHRPPPHRHRRGSRPAAAAPAPCALYSAVLPIMLWGGGREEEEEGREEGRNRDFVDARAGVSTR